MISLIVAAACCVSPVAEPVRLDGRLDEAAWRSAHWETGFGKLLKEIVDREVQAQTHFAVLADDRAFYVGVRCEEPDMAGVRSRKPSTLWHADSLELFVCPTGKSFDFYHFAVSYMKSNGRYSSFASEGGTIHPDPYRPDWDFAVADCEGGWSVEIAIPFSALYMTRNADWEPKWLFNLARTRRFGADGEGHERTTWSPLREGYNEPNAFRSLDGFPMRRPADDVALLGALATIDRKRPDGTLTGTMEVTARVLEGGEYELSSPVLATAAVKLAAGDNKVTAACAFGGNGRHDVRLELVRKATGERYVRDYPVIVDYEEIRTALVLPEFRGNFYPGQDASRVKGSVKTAVDGEVRVTLEGPGFPRREAALPSGGGAFDFDTRGFADGEALLTVEAGGAKRVSKVRKLAPTGHTMTWISKGNLIVNGKPVLRRNLYAMGYHGGRAFEAKVKADRDLHFTEEVSRGGILEPNRVIPGLERKEAIRDVRPCAEYFAKIDRMLEQSRDKDFGYWYISDEPECRGVSPVYLKHIYDYVADRDPYHVILTASRGGPRYVECADWFETHPYLNPHDDGHGNRCYGVAPKDMGRYLDDIGVSGRPDKCIGFLPTLFSYRGQSLLNDYPTFPEYVCHVWAAAIHGAKSLWPYAYHDFGDRAALYEGNRYVFSSFERLSDFLLLGERTWLMRSDVAKAVRYDLGTKSMFVLVNLTPEPRTVTLGGLGRKFVEFRGARTFADGVFALRPHETVIGTTAKCDRGLPTYAETAALVDRGEYARTHRDNQLLEKYTSVRVTTSNGRAGRTGGSGYKFIDGTRDVLAWGCPWSKRPWIELELTGGAVRFDRIRLYGAAITTVKAAACRGGEWTDLVPVGESDAPYFKELELARPVEADRVKLSFERDARTDPADALEIYEIELPNLR